jgi:hypothetical protein
MILVITGLRSIIFGMIDMPHKFREKDFVVLTCEIAKRGSKMHRENVTIRIPKQQWIVLVNKAVNSRGEKVKEPGRGGYG